MLKVFLVEDESVIREGFRDKIPWGQYGFELVGEAGDGEMALPMIRKLKPDLLITDIKMPFMDGLSLSEIVKEELPKARIIIISGYDDLVGKSSYLHHRIWPSYRVFIQGRSRRELPAFPGFLPGPAV